jgi:hypothetical protein
MDNDLEKIVEKALESIKSGLPRAEVVALIASGGVNHAVAESLYDACYEKAESNLMLPGQQPLLQALAARVGRMALSGQSPAEIRSKLLAEGHSGAVVDGMVEAVRTNETIAAAASTRKGGATVAAALGALCVVTFVANLGPGGDGSALVPAAVFGGLAWWRVAHVARLRAAV